MSLAILGVLIGGGLAFRGKKQRDFFLNAKWLVASAVAPAQSSTKLSPSIGALRRPHGFDDVAPPDVRALALKVTPSGAGVVDLAAGRRLLNAQSGPLYAFPTTKGWVTFVLRHHGGRSVNALTQHVAWIGEFDGKTTHLFGLAADDVLEIRHLPSSMQGEVAKNAFAFWGTGRITLRSFVVALADGTVLPVAAVEG